MKKFNSFKKILIDRFDILICIYLFFVINQGIHIEILSMGRIKFLEIFPLFLLTTIGLKNIFFNFNRIYKLIYVSLFIILLFSLNSAYLQKNIYPAIYTSVFVILIISCLNFSKNFRIEDKSLIKLFKYFIIINFFIILLCLLFGDSKYLRIDTFYRFRGIFDNANQLGRFCVISFVISLIAFEKFLKLENSFKFINLFNLFISFVLLLLSNSRLSLLLVCIAIFVFILLNFNIFLNLFHNLINKKLKTIIIYLLIIIIFFYFSYVSFNEVWSAISNKFLQSDILKVRGGITAYRLQYIIASLDYLNFFGHENYKLSTSICQDVLAHYSYEDQILACDVHNTYLSFWLKYGFHLAFFLFFGLVLVLRIAISYKQNNPKFVFISKNIILITPCLFVYYFFETGFLHILFILDLILFSYLINNFGNKA
jgi:hypothetical protein